MSDAPGPATCFFHRDRLAVKECPSCRTMVCGDCLLAEGDVLKCMRCASPAPVQPPAQAEPASVPWETGEGNFFVRFWASWIQFVSKPDQAFAGLPRDSGFWPGLSYVYMLYAHFVSLILLCGIPLTLLGFVAQFAPSGSGQGDPAMGVILLVLVIGFPLAGAVCIPIGLFLSAGAMHLAARALGSPASFDLSFRSMCYIVGTTSPVSIIPYAGAGCIVPIWNCVLYYFAGKRALRLSDERAVVFALVPVLLGVVCIGTGIATAVAAGVLLPTPR